MSYQRAVTSWIRLTAVSLLVFVAVAATAAADGGSTGIAGGSVDTTTASTPSAPATSTTGTGDVVTPPSTASTGTTSAPTANAALSLLNLTSHAFGSRMLKVGSRGTDVVALQHDLTSLGFTTSASGIFSRQTFSQLRAFQRRYHLTVDGVAGPTSISRLKRLLSSSLHIAETADGVAATASSSTSSAPLPTADTGGVGVVPLAPSAATTTVQDATMIDGLAIAAPGTPQVVVQVLDAANKIAFDPYIYGGGHASFTAAGYDCSGSVSFALHGGGLLATPLDSQQFLQYGQAGQGNWITIWTNGPTHAYMEVAGLWFDTAAQSATNGMNRWSLTRVAEPAQYGKFVPRHPAGW